MVVNCDLTCLPLMSKETDGSFLIVRAWVLVGKPDSLRVFVLLRKKTHVYLFLLVNITVLFYYSSRQSVPISHRCSYGCI